MNGHVLEGSNFRFQADGHLWVISQVAQTRHFALASRTASADEME